VLAASGAAHAAGRATAVAARAIDGAAATKAEASAAAGIGQQHAAEGAVLAEIATLALAGIAMQATAVASASAGAEARQAGTLKASGGVLLARATALAIVAGQVPGVAELLTRVTVTATGVTSAAWWAPTPIGGADRQRPIVTVVSGGDSGLSTRGPFG
jgi:hypothetical protein